jgi:hypothetical protein
VLRISQLDWPRILYNRFAVVLLGVAAVLSIAALFIGYGDLNPDTLGPVKGELVSILGGLGAFGFFALLVCMGFFWLRCDISSKVSRTVWFVLLLFGFSLGTQIAYYAIVYLPTVLRGRPNYEKDETDSAQLEAGKDRKRFGPFARPLLYFWGVIALPMIGFWIIPRSMPRLSEIAAGIFVLVCAVVVFEGIFHFIASLFRTGMQRPAYSDRADSSSPHDRH